MQQAVTWIQSQASTGALNTDAPANGYYAAAVEEPWTSASFWTTCTSCTTASDGAGNNVSWVINRVCKVAGSPNGAGNFCSSLNGSASNGGSYSSDAVNFTGSPKYYYRITVQVVDRRNSASLSQAFVTL